MRCAGKAITVNSRNRRGYVGAPWRQYAKPAKQRILECTSGLPSVVALANVEPYALSVRVVEDRIDVDEALEARPHLRRISGPTLTHP